MPGSGSDTIVAVASALGHSPRGIVRVSGADAFAILSRAAGRSAPTARGVHRFRFGSSLPCLLFSYPAPRSYTGEHSIEIQTAGNPNLLDRIANTLIEAGARQAEPGEFSARAYLNGRLSLVEAEGVAATIAAASDAQLRAARLMTGGRLNQLAQELADDLASALALVEAGIDFVDQEDVVAISGADLRERVASIRDRLSSTLSHSTGAERLSALPLVTLVGPPNAGKSSLFNALLGRRRAIVSSVTGTTRDALIEPMHLDANDPYSPEILLADVAGLEAGDAGLNPMMRRAALEALNRADLVMRLHAPDAPETSVAFTLADRSFAKVIDVRSKADLIIDIDSNPSHEDWLAVSVNDAASLDALRLRLARELRDLTASLAADSLALLPRHERALNEAQRRIQEVITRLDASVDPSQLDDPELIAAELRVALDAIGELAGDVTPDDVLGLIFAGFCVGK